MARADAKQKKFIIEKIREGLMSTVKGVPLSDQMPTKAKVTLHYPNSTVTIDVKLIEEDDDA